MKKSNTGSGRPQAWIWRKSVYNSGICPVCGTMLLADGTPKNVRVVDARAPGEEHGYARCFCRVCGLHVARVVPYGGEYSGNGMIGEWRNEEDGDRQDQG